MKDVNESYPASRAGTTEKFRARARIARADASERESTRGKRIEKRNSKAPTSKNKRLVRGVVRL